MSKSGAARLFDVSLSPVKHGVRSAPIREDPSHRGRAAVGYQKAARRGCRRAITVDLVCDFRPDLAFTQKIEHKVMGVGIRGHDALDMDHLAMLKPHADRLATFDNNLSDLCIRADLAAVALEQAGEDEIEEQRAETDRQIEDQRAQDVPTPARRKEDGGGETL
jgi:hypothetical protein